MGLRSPNSDCQVVDTLRGNSTSSQWLNLDSRRRKLTLSTSPSMSMTSREMARLTLSSPATSSELATSTPPSRQSLRLGHHREGTEDADQGRSLPHLQGRQGQQGPGRL